MAYDMKDLAALGLAVSYTVRCMQDGTFNGPAVMILTPEKLKDTEERLLELRDRMVHMMLSGMTTEYAEDLVKKAKDFTEKCHGQTH